MGCFLLIVLVGEKKEENDIWNIVVEFWCYLIMYVYDMFELEIDMVFNYYDDFIFNY